MDKCDGGKEISSDVDGVKGTGHKKGLLRLIIEKDLAILRLWFWEHL